LLSGKVEEIPDIHDDPEYAVPLASLGNVSRAMLGVPLLREDRVEGALTLTLREPGGFTQRQIELVQTFADQAVIAIENVRLFDEVRARTRDLTEALQQQTATADVLKVISRSAFDLQAVLGALLSSAVRLSGVRGGAIALRDGEALRVRAESGRDAEYTREILGRVITAGRGSVSGRVLLSGKVEQISDVRADPDFDLPPGGSFARLGVPMLRNGKVEGVIVLVRDEPGPFSPRVIELVQTFADQAVIAIENVRLFNEVQARTRDLTEALQQQTATAEVLKVISRSAFDLQAVFDTLTSSAVELIGGVNGTIFVRDGESFPARAHSGVAPEFVRVLAATPPTPGRQSATARVLLSGKTECIADVLTDKEYTLPSNALNRTRSLLATPLLREDRIEGVLVIGRSEPGEFTQRQIDLVQTFADQAVIAIENVRLFDEVQARTRDLTEALQQQTVTAEVLKVISRSAFDLQAVWRTLVESASTLCEAPMGLIELLDGDVFRLAMQKGYGEAFERYLLETPLRAGSSSGTGRAASTGEVSHIPDVLQDPDYLLSEAQRLAGYRSNLAVPLLRENKVIGVFVLGRPTPGPFTERQIELVKTFADQAVIAIENVRLFDEVQARTRDLSEALQLQTATSDVLKVISRSAFDLQAVFGTLISSAVELCGADGGTICVRDGEVFRFRASAGASQTEALTKYLEEHPATPGPGSTAGRVLLSGKVEAIPDCLEDPDYAIPMDSLSQSVRSILGVPLLRKEGIEGALVLTRKEPGHFTPRQVEIVQTFADQAVIAIENVRLFDEVQARTRELAASLDDLRKAQDRLIQSEKLASLGQLTAGIAHEIKNPLNFVNNYSTLSRELIDELGQALARAPLETAQRKETDTLTRMIRANLDKVAHHGKRADSIVKNMLLHSREGSGERSSVNVNAMVEEALNLAYHGARAEKPGFNVTIAKSLDPQAGDADLYPQEMTRVLLNLISNGFYATTMRKRGEESGTYEPTISASTRDLGDRVEIGIRDNGTGIPDEVKTKMFNPFFTTKPAGEGTGLGLSLSHDIVVKQHGGTLDVSTEPGSHTQFTIALPRAPQGAPAKAGASA
jgi:two-component system, NtrC family, sensor kinase